MAQLGLGKKFRAKPNPLLLEDQEPEMVPTYTTTKEHLVAWYDAAIKDLRRELDSKTGNVDQQKVLARLYAYEVKLEQIQNGDLEKKFHDDYINEFNCWLQGKSKYNIPVDKPNPSKEEKLKLQTTYWGVKPLIGESIREYLIQFPMDKLDMELQLTKLKMIPPNDIKTAWLYWKYIVSPRPGTWLPDEFHKDFNWYTIPGYKDKPQLQMDGSMALPKPADEAVQKARDNPVAAGDPGEACEESEFGLGEDLSGTLPARNRAINRIAKILTDELNNPDVANALTQMTDLNLPNQPPSSFPSSNSNSDNGVFPGYPDLGPERERAMAEDMSKYWPVFKSFMNFWKASEKGDSMDLSGRGPPPPSGEKDESPGNPPPLGPSAVVKEMRQAFEESISAYMLRFQEISASQNRDLYRQTIRDITDKMKETLEKYFDRSPRDPYPDFKPELAAIMKDQFEQKKEIRRKKIELENARYSQREKAEKELRDTVFFTTKELGEKVNRVNRLLEKNLEEIEQLKSRIDKKGPYSKKKEPLKLALEEKKKDAESDVVAIEGLLKSADQEKVRIKEEESTVEAAPPATEQVPVTKSSLKQMIPAQLANLYPASILEGTSITGVVNNCFEFLRNNPKKIATAAGIAAMYYMLPSDPTLGQMIHSYFAVQQSIPYPNLKNQYATLQEQYRQLQQSYYGRLTENQALQERIEGLQNQQPTSPVVVEVLEQIAERVEGANDPETVKEVINEAAEEVMKSNEWGSMTQVAVVGAVAIASVIAMAYIYQGLRGAPKRNIATRQRIPLPASSQSSLPVELQQALSDYSKQTGKPITNELVDFYRQNHTPNVPYNPPSVLPETENIALQNTWIRLPYEEKSKISVPFLATDRGKQYLQEKGLYNTYLQERSIAESGVPDLVAVSDFNSPEEYDYFLFWAEQKGHREKSIASAVTAFYQTESFEIVQEIQKDIIGLPKQEVQQLASEYNELKEEVETKFPQIQNRKQAKAEYNKIRKKAQKLQSTVNQLYAKSTNSGKRRYKNQARRAYEEFKMNQSSRRAIGLNLSNNSANY